MELLLTPSQLAPALAEVWALLLWLLVGLGLYAALFSRTVFDGAGSVPARLFGPTDAGIAAGLMALFGVMMAAGSRGGGGAPENAAPALPDAGAMILAVAIVTSIFGAMMAGILTSLHARRIDWRAAFGGRAVGPLGVPPRAVFLLALAIPLVTGALFVSRLLLGSGGGEEEQEIVRFFAGSDSTRAKWVVALSAMVLAPVQEEFVFRGYLYPVLKRYVGPFLGLAINAALFAGIHLHAPSFAGLFVLAGCLTLAYEWTGSLFVPMAMHALFNSITVVNLLSRGG